MVYKSLNRDYFDFDYNNNNTILFPLKIIMIEGYMGRLVSSLYVQCYKGSNDADKRNAIQEDYTAGLQIGLNYV